MVAEKNCKIEQRAFLKGRQSFEINSKGELEVAVNRFSIQNRFTVPLWHLNPSPTRHKRLQTDALAGSVVFGFCATLCVFGMVVVKDTGTGIGLVIPLLLFMGVLCACLWKLKAKSINANIYYFRNGQGQLHVWHDNPSPEVFRSFCDTFSKAAEEAWNNRPVDPAPQSLAGELAALKKLKDSGALTEAEFERAKSKLLDQAEQRRIGFA